MLVPSFGVALVLCADRGIVLRGIPRTQPRDHCRWSFDRLPLLLFAIAARKLPYSTLGFIQFLAPSIVFILGLTVFGEELKPAQGSLLRLHLGSRGDLRMGYGRAV